MAFVELDFQAGPDDAGRRLDRIIKSLLPGHALSALYRMLRSGDIRLNGKKASPETVLSLGDRIGLRLPEAEARALSALAGRPAAGSGGLALGPATGQAKDQASYFAGLIVWSSPDLIVVNKPRGLLSHGPGGIDELALAYLSDRSSRSLSFRPAPLHRLDRNTSGALAVSASMAGAQAFSEALRNGELIKLYLAVLEGRLEEKTRWRDWLRRDTEARISRIGAQGSAGGDPAGAAARPASLSVHPLAWTGDGSRGFTLAAVELETGLTHQIRAQCAHHGHPLAGDLKYGGSPFPGGLGPEGGALLHCALLSCPQDTKAALPCPALAPLPPGSEAAVAGLFGARAPERAYSFIDSFKGDRRRG